MVASMSTEENQPESLSQRLIAAGQQMEDLRETLDSVQRRTEAMKAVNVKSLTMNVLTAVWDELMAAQHYEASRVITRMMTDVEEGRDFT
jgi:hypothetical protein